MNEYIKSAMLAAIHKAYPGVLFISVHIPSTVMQLYFKDECKVESCGFVSKGQLLNLQKMLGMDEIIRIHIFIGEKTIHFINHEKTVTL